MTVRTMLKSRTEPAGPIHVPVFPGRWLGGGACILAPLVLLTGIVLRLPEGYFFTDQLAAYFEAPGRIGTAYSAVVLGWLLLVPAVVALGSAIARTHPGWAFWGTLFGIVGLCARIFHAGIDHMAFQIVDTLGLSAAGTAVGGSYQAFYILQIANPLIMASWIVLAAGAFLSGFVGFPRAIALGMMAALMIGVLKGSTITSVVVVAGLSVVLIPLGVRLLREGPMPPSWTVGKWAAAIVAGLGVLIFLGQAG